MDYNKIAQRLQGCDTGKVGIYLNYLKEVESAKDSSKKLVNWWFGRVTEEQYADIFKRVRDTGLFIDGKTVTLQFKGKLMVSYDYNAYKNLMLLAYPESEFDIQNVFEGDTFSFKKESGKVLYKHTLANPFEDNKRVIGCYCIIKNRRGEFIETLNLQEIDKMKAVAKTKKIWDTWFSEMTLKSVIKRACKRHFNDVVTDVETLDNENYDLEQVNVPNDLQMLVSNCNTEDELQDLYRIKKHELDDEIPFINMLTARKKEIKSKLT